MPEHKVLISTKALLGLCAALTFSQADAVQRTVTHSERAIVNSNTFLDAHPDLMFRLRGMDLWKTKEPEKALAAFKRAALYADKPSQAFVAGMYWEGQGVERDRALAYAWMDLAAERGYPDFIAMREKFWGELNESERARALQEGQAIYARYGDAVANPRLERELRRERMQVVGSRTGFTGNAKIHIPLPSAVGASGDPGAGGASMVIDGSEFYADKFWEPKQYQAWLDAQWKEPRSGRVEVGTFKTDEKPAKTRIEPPDKKSGKP